MEFKGPREPDARFIIGHTLEGGDPLKHVTPQEIKRMGELGLVVSRQQMRAAASLLGVIAERGAEDITAGRVDAVLQSESAGHGLIAAYADPSKFHNIVLAFPGSISGKRIGFLPGRLLRDLFARRKERPLPEDDFRNPDRLRRGGSIRMQIKAPGFRENASALRHSDLSICCIPCVSKKARPA